MKFLSLFGIVLMMSSGVASALDCDLPDSINVKSFDLKYKNLVGTNKSVKVSFPELSKEPCEYSAATNRAEYYFELENPIQFTYNTGELGRTRSALDITEPFRAGGAKYDFGANLYDMPNHMKYFLKFKGSKIKIEIFEFDGDSWNLLKNSEAQGVKRY